MTAVRRAGNVLRGLVALVVLVALTAGVPILLVATVGNPVPSGWTWTGSLTNDAILGLLACVAWVFWAQLVLCVVVEVLAEIRLATGRSADWLARIPGTFGGQQTLARVLVQAVVAIGATSAVVGSAGPWVTHADAAEPAQPAVAADPIPQAAVGVPQPKGTTTTEVIVERGDTLWSIAERHLGAGERWREIAELNDGHRMNDGSTFVSAHTILPGWSLAIPSTAPAHLAHDVVTVETGNTLWEIAAEEYGDGTKWPRIYRPNKDKIGDPHWIYPGQRFVIPDQGRVETPKAQDPRDDPPPIVDPPQEQSEPEAKPEDTPTPSLEPIETSAPGSPTAADAAHSAGEDGGWHLDTATVTRALLGGGGFLAAAMLSMYVGRRRTQTRNRPSGRAAPRVAQHLRAEEKALRGIGGAALAPAAFFDSALRELAQRAEDEGFALPEVVSARLDDQSLDLCLAVPTGNAPRPWQAASEGTVWRLTRAHVPVVPDRMAPYPAIVTLGDDAEGGTWFVDLEGAGVIQVVGDAEVGADLVRFIAAELALNPWTDVEGVSVVGIAEDVVRLNQGRLFADPELDIERLTKVARQMADTIAISGRDVLASRVADWANGWVPEVTVAAVGARDKHDASQLVGELLDEMERVRGRTSVVLLTLCDEPITSRAFTLTATEDGALSTPWGVVKPNRLTSTEADTLGRMFDDADTDGDELIPTAIGTDGEPTPADEAGALVEKLTEARCTTGDPYSVLPRPDRAYVEAAATTAEDLSALAPAVPPSETAAALANDPGLDADLADWLDPATSRPKLRVLGPVELHAKGEKTKEVESRPAYFAELTAYLSCHPNGLTPNQVAADFRIQNNTLHTRLGQLRRWLAKKPDSGEWYLPNAQWMRGQKIYRLDGILCDADLFRRLRSRGEARGPEGIEDLRRALNLVEGPPYDQQRSKGYGWLVDTPADHYLTAAIVDVAHVVATHALTEGDPNLALWAAEKAILAAPSEDKPRLDLARARQLMGEEVDAERYLGREILNRSDDDRAPLDTSHRTKEIIHRFNQRGHP